MSSCGLCGVQSLLLLLEGFFAELAHRIESISWGDLCVTPALMPCWRLCCKSLSSFFLLIYSIICYSFSKVRQQPLLHSRLLC